MADLERVDGQGGGDGQVVARWGEGDVLEPAAGVGSGGSSPRPTRQATRATEPEASAFLAGLAAGLSATGAARQAKISRQRAYEWRQADPEFAARWAVAYSAGTELYEDETRRRALLGVEEPVWYQGQQVGTKRVPSDRLMELVLKARAPEKYRERVDHQVTAVPLTPAELKAAREAGMRPEVEAAARTIASLPVIEGSASDAG